LTYIVISVKKNITRIRLRVLIQPNFVKKSYLYLGIPPRIKIKNAIKITNLIPNIIEYIDVVFIKKVGYDKRSTTVKLLYEKYENVVDVSST
jgi:hypothetical protein